jgi:hypothetical protein
VFARVDGFGRAPFALGRGVAVSGWLAPLSSKLITTPFVGCLRERAKIRAAFASSSGSGLRLQLLVGGSEIPLRARIRPR